MLTKNHNASSLRRAVLAGSFAVVAALTIGAGTASAQYYQPYQYGNSGPYYSHYPNENWYQMRRAWWDWRREYWRWYHENYR